MPPPPPGYDPSKKPPPPPPRKQTEAEPAGAAARPQIQPGGIRGARESFGRQISEVALMESPRRGKMLAPRSYVDFYHMATRMGKPPFMTDFQHIEFAWWWKTCAGADGECLENCNYLLDIIVSHLKGGKGQKSQEVVALATNTIAFLYLFGFIERPSNASAALAHYNKMLMLLKSFDDTEAKDRTTIEMCAHNLVVKIKQEANSKRRALSTGKLDTQQSLKTGYDSN